jgi:hypothetical protein
MSLTDNRDTFELAGARSLQANAAILNTEIIYAGGMSAIDYAGELQMASDSAGLRVLGRSPLYKDNTADGETANIERGIFLYENSASKPVVRGMIGRVCYVEDDATVAAGSTHLIAAGLVYDVTSDGVYVDQRAESLASAVALARIKEVSVTGTTVTVSAAQAFQGNVVLACDNAAGVTVTLPSAVSGYRIGVQRTSATAAHDVTIAAASGDTVRGSAAAGTASNTTDAVSGILWLEAESATAWIDAAPLAPDRAVWVASA